MKIAYIVNARIPTEKAHGYQIMKVCESLSLAGVQVELILPNRVNEIKEDPFSYYDIKKIFSIFKVKTLNFISLSTYIGKLAFVLHRISFFINLIDLRLNKDTIIYSRDPEIVWLFKKKGYKAFYNAHNYPSKGDWVIKFFLRDTDGIICNSNGTKDRFSKAGFVNTEAVQNGVDLDEFKNIKESKEELRKSLNLPIDKKIAMYVGHLYKWKGVYTLIDVAKIIDPNIDIVIVGGNKDDLVQFDKACVERGVSNIILLGHKEKSEIPKYMMSADALLLPNIPVTEESEMFTSPIKMFEYMASGVPIIASDMPSIREVLNDTNSILVRAGDALEIVGAFKKIIGNFNEISNISNKAKEDAGNYTWGKHAERLVNFIQK